MAESELNCDKNPLRIVEDEVLSCDRIGDNESTCEMFDFSDVEESESSSSKRNSLLIIEEKDLMMDGTGGDLNNNNRHRLSLQVESGDENSLVMMNEAINRTIIRIGSNASSVDFGEVGGGAVDKPHEAVNRAVNERRGSENFQDNDGEAIVNILGQINDIVGCTRTVNCFVSTRSGAGCCFSLLSVITNKQVGSSTMSHGFFFYFQAEARLAAKRQARAEAREIRMRELDRQQKELERVYDMQQSEVLSTPRSRLTVNNHSSALRGNSMSSRRSSEDSLEEEGRSLRDLRHELKVRIVENLRKWFN